MASLEALAGFDHIQEVILQNFVPHRRYYGEEPADIATEAAERFWRTGLSDAPHHDAPEVGDARSTIEDMKRLIAETRRLMPDVGIQVPPNLARLVAGAGRGRRHRPRRPVGQRRPHLARAPVPVARSRCASGSPRTSSRSPSGCASTRSTSNDEWIAPRVLDVIRDRYRAFIPRRTRAGAVRPDTIERARDGQRADAGGARGDVRREPARGDRGHAPGRRRAARRARGRHRHVRRQPQHQRLQRLHRRLRVLRLRRRQALARRLRARPRASSSAASTTPSRSARPRSACSRASTPTGGSRTTSAGCGWRRRSRRRSTCTRTARWRSRTCATSSGLPPHEVFAQLREAGLDSVPGTAAEVLARRRPPADQPEQAAGRALGGDHRGRPPTSACARP